MLASWTQVKVKLGTLFGDIGPRQPASTGKRAAAATNGTSRSGAVQPVALYVEAQLCAYGETLGLPCRTRWASPEDGVCSWSDWLAFPIKVRSRDSLIWRSRACFWH